MSILLIFVYLEGILLSGRLGGNGHMVYSMLMFFIDQY